MQIMSVDVFDPIPCLDEARELKVGFRDHPIDPDQPLFDEPLVALADYGVEGVNYYSQPNNATIDPVEGVTPNVFVRRTVAEKLAAADEFLLAHDGLAAMFDGRIKLYVRDGFRSPVLQEHLNNTVIPNLIRTQNPQWSEQQVAQRASQVMTSGLWSESSIPPHFTGGAADVILVRADDGSIINTGFKIVTLGSEAIHTDHLEAIDVEEHELVLARYARRALYNVLTSNEVGNVAMTNNPTETWHFSIYDQMWARLSNQPAALYGVPPEIPEELNLVEINN